MIIDVHTHIGRNEHINSSVDDLLSSMDKAGIDKSLVFAGELNDAPNDWMLKEIAPHKDRLLGVAAYTPPPYGGHWSAEYARQNLTNLYGEGKIVAVKFYTGYDHYYPSELHSLLQVLEEAGCPAIFHSGDCLNSVKCAKVKYAHPLHIDEVAVDFPKMNFIIAHMGFPWVLDTAEVCYKNANVYTDISGFVYGDFKESDQKKFESQLTKFLEIAGSDKLLFGSDFPISNQKSYRSVVEKSMFIESLTQNAQRAFKLP